MINHDSSVDDIEAEWKKCVSLRESILQDRMRIEAELSARKRRLKELMAACTEAGFNPSTIAEDIRHLREVTVLKISTFQADLEAAQGLIAPMLREIGG